MSTFPKKKNPNSTGDRNAREPDLVSVKKLVCILAGMSALICGFMIAEANRSGLWREMIISSTQVVGTAIALYFILRPRRKSD